MRALRQLHLSTGAARAASHGKAVTLPGVFTRRAPPARPLLRHVVRRTRSLGGTTTLSRTPHDLRTVLRYSNAAAATRRAKKAKAAQRRVTSSSPNTWRLEATPRRSTAAECYFPAGTAAVQQRRLAALAVALSNSTQQSSTRSSLWQLLGAPLARLQVCRRRSALDVVLS